MNNEGRQAMKRVKRLLNDKNISSYRIAKQTGLSNSQIIRIRKAKNLDNVKLATIIKIIDYINEVESDPFRTK